MGCKGQLKGGTVCRPFQTSVAFSIPIVVICNGISSLRSFVRSLNSHYSYTELPCLERHTHTHLRSLDDGYYYRLEISTVYISAIMKKERPLVQEPTRRVYPNRIIIHDYIGTSPLCDACICSFQLQHRRHHDGDTLTDSMSSDE